MAVFYPLPPSPFPSWVSFQKKKKCHYIVNTSGFFWRKKNNKTLKNQINEQKYKLKLCVVFFFLLFFFLLFCLFFSTHSFNHDCCCLQRTVPSLGANDIDGGDQMSSSCLFLFRITNQFHKHNKPYRMSYKSRTYEWTGAKVRLCLTLVLMMN